MRNKPNPASPCRPSGKAIGHARPKSGKSHNPQMSTTVPPNPVKNHASGWKTLPPENLGLSAKNHLLPDPINRKAATNGPPRFNLERRCHHASDRGLRRAQSQRPPALHPLKSPRQPPPRRPALPLPEPSNLTRVLNNSHPPHHPHPFLTHHGSPGIEARQEVSRRPPPQSLTQALPEERKGNTPPAKPNSHANGATRPPSGMKPPKQRPPTEPHLHHIRHLALEGHPPNLAPTTNHMFVQNGTSTRHSRILCPGRLDHGIGRPIAPYRCEPVSPVVVSERGGESVLGRGRAETDIPHRQHLAVHALPGAGFRPGRGQTPAESIPYPR